MKQRICHILISLLLSVTIVSLGSGVTLMRCMHSGTVSMATLADLHDSGCGSNCMEVTVLQLDNLTSAPSLSVDFQPASQLAAVVSHLLAYWALPIQTAKSPIPVLPLLQKGPPRAYLTLLHTLLI